MACTKYRSVMLLGQGDWHICSNSASDEEVEACPQCKDGILRRRNGPYGPFLGCSNWNPEGPSSCDYKRNLQHRR